MTEYETYQEHIRYAHNAYCRIVIRHASFSAARMLATRWKRELSFEYLTEEKFVPFSTTDEYFFSAGLWRTLLIFCPGTVCITG